ncbi:hypothetical protein V1477_021109 [Vespula maculifrons]|uniref:Uncharacterized protein n=1 Tax=Vespula maculifrons TaxID=7453 RepID=A0ABD2AI41_VESMC
MGWSTLQRDSGLKWISNGTGTGLSLKMIKSACTMKRLIDFRYSVSAETRLNYSLNIQQGACLVAYVCAYSDCGVWGMNTSYQRTSGKIVGHSFGGCGTSNTPDSALLYIFSTFIHHTSQRGGCAI